MRTLVMVLLAVTFAGAPLLSRATTAGDEKGEDVAKAELSVAIAAPERFGKRNIDAGGTFNVVISNMSKRDVGVWREWCSWGYYQLTLVFCDAEDADAEPVVVRKKERIWTKNYPDFWMLAAGEPLVWPVKLESGDWELGPLEGKLRGRRFAVKAVFSANEDAESKKNDVWSGSVTSAEHIYHIN